MPEAGAPMFPLGMTLLPGELLPMRIFEPRYRQLLLDCLAANIAFGTVLIDRGSEVGGGDVRRDVGVLCRFVRVEPQFDGTFSVIAAGIGRLRITRWLDDDPYPRAIVEPWPDEDVDAAKAAYRQAGPLGPHDRYDVLRAPDDAARRDRLTEALESWELAQRFAAGDDPPPSGM